MNLLHKGWGTREFGWGTRLAIFEKKPYLLAKSWDEINCKNDCQ